MIAANRFRAVTRAYKRSPRRVRLRHQPELALANNRARQYGPDLWVDARDIRDADGSLQTWPAKFGTAPTQATAGLRPTMNQDGWAADGGPAVDFSGDPTGDALLTDQILTGETGTAVSTAKTTDAGIGARVLWEQTELYNSAANGAIFGAASSGAPTSGVYAGAGGGAGGDFKVGTLELDGVETCLAATYDRASASFDEEIYVDGAVDAASQSADIAVAGNFGAGIGSWIGSRNNGAARPWNGPIRELFITNTELTAPQVLDLCNILRWKARLL